MREQGHRENTQAGNAALRHADHKGAENGEYPLKGLEGHDSTGGIVTAEAPADSEARRSIVGVELTEAVQVDNDVEALVDGQLGPRGKVITGVEIRDSGMQVVHRALEHFLRHPF